jgi:DNA-binding SARP family transcriptional activator/ABC-type branched-subunit amino acid transport system substrate-binding protein/streptogramin lyase
MRFRLLGSLEVIDGTRRLEIGAPKVRALLAMLLLHRGEAVSVDRLADALWGDSPPPTAAKAVQVYVAQLRKALGEGLVVTRAGGYAITLDAHDLDIDRFDELLAKGRLLLERGETRAGADALRDALALWHGLPLADFQYEEFACDEIARLEEERLCALEARVEAELALGRHEELVPELRDLVRRHPLRERLCAQLMLALYRCGRQAEALEAYRQARARLVEELGLEPARELRELEQAILTQDPRIGRPRPPPPVSRRAPRRPAALIIAGGTLLLAAAVAVLLLGRGGGGGIGAPVPADSLVAIDPDSGRIVASVPVGAGPVSVSVGDHGVWVLNGDAQTLSRVDPDTKATRTFGIGATPTDVAAGLGAVWVGNGGHARGAQFAGRTATALTRLDPSTGAARASVVLPRRGGVVSNASLRHIAFAAGSIWAINPDFSVSRIDPRSNRVMAVVRGLSSIAIAADGRRVWTLDEDNTLARIDPGRNRVAARIKVPAVGLGAIALGAGSVWATDSSTGLLWRIDPGAQVAERTIDVGAGADALAFGEGRVWVTNGLRGTLTTVSPGSNRVTRSIAIGSSPRAVTVGEHAVWVAVAGSATLSPVQTKRVGQARPVPAGACGPVLSGPDPPRSLIVSDLPLQGGPRFSTLQMSQAILYVLRRHRFHAGSHVLGYQSCDDSVARTGLFDVAKCAGNAKAYAADKSVVGVVGPYNSGCAQPQIPIANRADLSIVSPTNSDVGLTRRAFGAPRGALRSLYPTGRRTYARLMSPDDAQGAAEALLARRLGARRPFVLHDGGYGAGIAHYAARALTRLGTPPVRTARWDWRHPDYRPLARSISRRRADAVVLCGLIDTDAGAMLAAVRRALGPGAPIIGCDGLLPASLLFEKAGARARGTYVTIEGLVNELLPPAGRVFVRDFRATQPAGRVDSAAVYAAEATEVLLDAIARSDDTRRSVVRKLAHTRIQDGLLGTFAIDPNGDPAPAPITVVRLERRTGANTILSYDGARVLRSIAPPPRLWQAHKGASR